MGQGIWSANLQVCQTSYRRTKCFYIVIASSKGVVPPTTGLRFTRNDILFSAFVLKGMLKKFKS